MSKLILSLMYSAYGVVVLAAACALYRFKSLDAASRIFAMYVFLSFFCETIAMYVAARYKNNLSVYSVNSLVEFGIMGLYFNASIDTFKKKHIGYYIAVGGIIMGLINLLFIQGVRTLNSYFLVFEGICIIGMSLFFFFRLLLREDDLKLYKNVHFWFATILSFFWSATFINWSLYDYFTINFKDKVWVADISRLIAGIIAYLGVCAVFILYPKMQKQYE